MKTKKELEAERSLVWKELEKLQSKVDIINREIRAIPIDYSQFIGKIYYQEDIKEGYKFYFYVQDVLVSTTSNFSGLAYTFYTNDEGIKTLDNVSIDYKDCDFFTQEDVFEISRLNYDLVTLKVCKEIMSTASASN